MSSFTELTGTALLTSSRCGLTTSRLTGAKSLIGSYGRLLDNAGLIVSPPEVPYNSV
jgi:hypothetical protein